MTGNPLTPLFMLKGVLIGKSQDEVRDFLDSVSVPGAIPERPMHIQRNERRARRSRIRRSYLIDKGLLIYDPKNQTHQCSLHPSNGLMSARGWTNHTRVKHERVPFR